MYLRYHSTNLELRDGAFVVGRSSNCDLRLDDGLVSRRHVVFHVRGSAVTLEDLGSRNGVAVNGARVEGSILLQSGDRILIGQQELVFHQDPPGAEGPGTRTLASVTMDARRDRITMANLPAVSAADTPPAVEYDEEDDDHTRQASTFALIAGIADKSLALGRFEEAERMLDASLRGILERLEVNDPVKDETWRQALGFALRLAEGPTGARWVGWLIQVHMARKLLMDAVLIDRMHDLVRARRFQDLGMVRRYLAEMRQLSIPPSDRFRFRRLEALERVVAAN